MRGYVMWLAALSMFTLLGACAGRSSRPVEAAAPAPAPTEETKRVPPPPDSPLAKVREGMTMGQVAEILGQPSDQNQYVTGKAFIPWYFGDDATRVEWHYKGVGRVIFTGGGAFGQRGGEVQWVEHDPDESGYRH